MVETTFILHRTHLAIATPLIAFPCNFSSVLQPRYGAIIVFHPWPIKSKNMIHLSLAA